MALINCPECQKQVSDKADACPNCGNPLNIKTGAPAQNIKVESKEGCFLQTMNAGCMIIFVIIGVFILAMFCA
ncbi:MAG: hypothetical protein RLO03_13865 [Balneola sp.]